MIVKQQIPLNLRHTPTKVHGVTYQSTAVFTVRLVTCSVSFLLLPFPIRRSSFCVCSVLLPAMDQWRKLLSFSCFIPSPRQKKPTLTLLAHTLEACPVLLGNSSPGGMWVSPPVLLEPPLSHCCRMCRGGNWFVMALWDGALIAL